MNRFQILKGEEPIPEKIECSPYAVSFFGTTYPAKLNQVTMFSHTNGTGRRADITVCIDTPDNSRFWKRATGSLCGARIILLEIASQFRYTLYVQNVDERIKQHCYGRASLELDISAIIEKGDL